MKKIVTILSIFLLAASAPAQSQAQSEEEIIREIWGMALKDLTAEALQLNQQEADLFWPIWDQYRVQRREIVNKKLMYIADYGANYNHMTNEKASEITAGLLKNEQQLIKLKSGYLKKVTKALSAIKAAQFIQIESTIDNELRAFVMENIPFMPDPKK